MSDEINDDNDAWGILYGNTIPPVIPGFSVSVAPDEWVMARQGARAFFVGVHKRGHRLFPLVQGRIRPDRVIFIPRE